MKSDFLLPSRYKIVREIGTGAAGAVYEAEDSVTGSNIAVKILSEAAPAWAASFEQEFRTLSDLSHRNLVNVLDYGTTGSGRPYFTMDLVRGRDLRSFLDDPGSSKHLVRAIFEILTALKYLEDKGLIHADIKPQNILIDEEHTPPRPVLVDFGMAGRFESRKETVQGTPRYIAPEVLESRAYSQLSDQYSLGVTLAESILGIDFPIFAGAEDDRISEISGSLEKKLESIVIENPASLAQFIVTLTRTDPSRRMNDFRHAIDHYITHVSGSISPVVNWSGHLERKEYREEFLDFLDSPPSKANCLLLEGPSGVGKHKLQESFSDMSQSEGILAIPINRRISRIDIDSFIGLLGNHLGTDLEKELRRKHSSIMESIEGERGNVDLEKLNVAYSSISEFIGRLSKDSRMIFLINDIESLGVGVLDFLTNAIRSLRYMKADVKFVLSLNSDIRTEEESARIARSLSAAPHVSRIQVSPFSEGEIQVLLREYFGSMNIPGFEIKRILDLTKGLPLHIDQYLRYLVREGIIRHEAGRFIFDHSLAEGLEYEPTRTDLAAETVSSLSEEAIEILQIIAIMEEGVELADLAAISGIGKEDLNRKLTTAAESGIVENKIDTWSISSPVYAQVILKGEHIKPPESRYLKAADHFAASGSRNLSKVASLYIKAGDHEKATEYAVRAAEEQYSISERYELYDLLSRLWNAAGERIEESPQYKDLLSIIAPLQLSLGFIDDAYENFKELVQRSDSATERSGHLTQLGHIHSYHKGQPDKASDYYQQAVDCLNPDKNKIEIAEIYFEWGGSTRTIEEYEKAIDMAPKGHEVKIKSLANILYHYVLGGETEKSKEVVNKIKEHVDSENTFIKIKVLYSLQIYAFYSGDYTKAEEYALKLMEIAESISDEIRKIKYLLLLGGIYYVRGDFTSQIRILHNVLSLIHRFNATSQLLTALSNLILGYISIGNYERALNLINESKEGILIYEIEQPPPYYYSTIAHTYALLGDAMHSEFIVSMKHLMNESIVSENRINRGHWHYTRSQYHLFNLDFDRCISQGSRAFELFRDADSKDDLVDVSLLLARAFIEKGDRKSAERFLDIASRLYPSVNCDYLSPMLMLVKGMFANQAGDARAVSVLERSIELAEYSQASETLWMSCRELGRYYLSIGDLNGAARYYRKATEALKRMYSSISSGDLQESFIQVPLRRRVFEEIKRMSS